MSNLVRVKREGGRGHHLIARAKYEANPGAFDLLDADGAPLAGMDILREQYQAKFGKRPFMGWDSETLRAKLMG
jgi:hypothetical protein